MSDPKRRSTRERWARILEATRELGVGNRSSVAKAAGVHRSTVAKAWTDGWPRYDLPPINDELARDRAAARAILQDGRVEAEPKRDAVTPEEAARIQAHVDAELERTKARLDVAEARAEEAGGVRVFRRNAITLGAMVARLSRIMIKLPEKLEAVLERDAAELSSKDLVALMRSTTRVAKESVEAMHRAMVLERLLLGEPGEIVEIRDGDMSEEEAVAWIRRASDAVERRERFEDWGKLELVKGGNG